MATSPTVLASSSSATPAPAPAPPKFPIVPLMISILVGVTVASCAMGGALYYLARTGRLPLQMPSTAKVEPAVPITTHVMVLEPMLVNLADSGGNAYLRVSVALRVGEAADKKAAKQNAEKTSGDAAGSDQVVEVRDTALTVLGRQTSDALLAAGGKEHLKAELKSAFAERNSGLKVIDVFFTDFLVQR